MGKKKKAATKMMKVHLDTYGFQINLVFSSLFYTNLVIKEWLKRLLNARSSAFVFFYMNAVCVEVCTR